VNSRVTVGLVIVALVLGGYVYFFEFQGNGQNGPELREHTGVRVHNTVYGEYDVIGLEVTGTQSTARFVRTDDSFTRDWVMVAPTARSPEEIDQVLVNGSATRLAGLTASQVITGATGMAQYGLASPELTVTLTISNGQKINLYTGAATPVNDNRYLKTGTDEQTVYLVPGFAIEALYDLLEQPQP
jgi:hypothetical protein